LPRPRSSPSEQPADKAARKRKAHAWTGDELLHLLDNSLAHLAMTTSILQEHDFPRQRMLYHMQMMQFHVQYLALVAQAWVLLNEVKTQAPARFQEAHELNEVLVIALRAYDREQLGIDVRTSPELPRLRGDRRQWQFLFRALIHMAVMQGQRCRIEVLNSPGKQLVTLKFRRYGQVEGGLTATALRLLLEACYYIIERHGGQFTVKDAHVEDWRAVATMPYTEPQDLP